MQNDNLYQHGTDLADCCSDAVECAAIPRWEDFSWYLGSCQLGSDLGIQRTHDERQSIGAEAEEEGDDHPEHDQDDMEPALMEQCLEAGKGCQ